MKLLYEQIQEKHLGYFDSKIIKLGNESGCWMWDGGGPKRYGWFGLRDKKRVYGDLAHRVAWMIYHNRNVPDGMFVCHTCDRMWCVNPNHLYAGTPKENAMDRELRGRSRRGADHWSARMPDRIPRGENAGLSKLSAEKVIEIRERYKSGEFNSPELGRMFGVTKTTIMKIVNRLTWSHIP